MGKGPQLLYRTVHLCSKSLALHGKRHRQNDTKGISNMWIIGDRSRSSWTAGWEECHQECHQSDVFRNEAGR